jgi:hypothetical protein
MHLLQQIRFEEVPNQNDRSRTFQQHSLNGFIPSR